jgi:hypothetical protein
LEVEWDMVNFVNESLGNCGTETMDECFTFYIWALRCKRFPDGMIRKLKARLCARGDTQLEGVDFFETFVPVCNCQTVRIMLIIFSLFMTLLPYKLIIRQHVLRLKLTSHQIILKCPKDSKNKERYCVSRTDFMD